MSYTKKIEPELSAAIIQEMTPKKIMEEAKVTKSTVSWWKTAGMPVYLQKYLRARYPELKVWSKFNVEL